MWPLLERLLVLAIAFLASFVQSNNPNGDLLLVQIVHRHGDRTPVFIDPLYADQWATVAPPGQLTTIGMAQHKAFGQMLRNQYVIDEPFLDYNYTNAHVHVRSTDFDRTLMSVQSLLSELYPGAFVPVHTVPNEQDYLLQPIDTCPSYTSQATVYQSVNDQSLIANNALLINQTLTATGLIDNYLLTGASALMITAYDNYVCMNAHGFTPTQGYTDIYGVLHDQVKHLWYGQYVDANVASDPRGPMGAMMLQTIYQNMLDASAPSPGGSGFHSTSASSSSQKTSDAAAAAADPHLHTVKGERIPSELHINVEDDHHMHKTKFGTQGTGTSTNADGIKLYIYSAHDTTLLALFTALEAIANKDDPKITPPYASSVVFELRKMPTTGQLNVLAYYGYPEKVDGEPPTSILGWDYVQDSLALMCPTANSPCVLSQWGAHIAVLTANVGAATAGCCQITTAFTQLQCNQWSTPAANLDADCGKYRQACPVSSCAGQPNSVLDESTMTCVQTSAANVVPPTCPPTQPDSQMGYNGEHKYKDYTIGLAVVSILLFLGLIGSILYYRNKVLATSYGSLQERMSHAQFV